MKTKIIYISGNEIFAMADIRAAFDEVRAALGLASDTVLFGVPVDADDAITQTIATDEIQPAPITEPVAPESEIKNEQIDVIPTNETEIVKKAPVKKPRGRPARVAPAPMENMETTAAPTNEIIPDTAENTTAPQSSDNAPMESETVESAPIESATVESEPAADEQNEKIIPILSILAAKNTQSETSEPAPVEIVEPEKNDSVPTPVDSDIAVDEVIISDVNITTELTETDNTDTPEISTETVSITDMITDDAPSAPIEKTLEQLLESMTPLREDIAEEHINDTTSEPDEITPVVPDAFSDDTDDADATLAQLATEFAENQDKIVAAPKNQSHGKIGKLKNILPFKKAKRDESGLMGDLFGWAGIAANDEDFSMPGFFTGAAIKK